MLAWMPGPFELLIVAVIAVGVVAVVVGVIWLIKQRK